VLRFLSDRVAFTDPALKVNLERLERAWEDYQSCRDRDGIYRYLTPVFELVTWWAHGDIAEIYARRAISRKAGRPVKHVPEPFAAIILCTTDPEKVDYRMRSKWSRALRYAAKYKRLEESLSVFIKRKGGINKCAARYALRLGRVAHISHQTKRAETSKSRCRSCRQSVRV
jgi:hypothetical protein